MSRCCVVRLKRREGVSERYLVCLIPAMAIDCSLVDVCMLSLFETVLLLFILDFCYQWVL